MKQKTNELRGVWWNVWLDARDKPDGARAIADKVARLVHEHQLDWICLQEVFRYDMWGAKGNLIQLIEDALGWKGVFVEGRQFHYENKRFKPGNNYTDGIATFSKWPIKSNQTITLGVWTEREDLPGRGRRTLLNTVLATPLGEITVGNTHWTRIHHKYRSHRKSEMTDFRQHISQLSPKLPYVVGGDFNTLPSHPIIRQLSQLLDLRTGTARHTTWLHTGKRRGIIRCNLDYVGTFRSGPLALLDFKLLNRRPSDHSPLLGVFRLQYDSKKSTTSLIGGASKRSSK